MAQDCPALAVTLTPARTVPRPALVLQPGWLRLGAWLPKTVPSKSARIMLLVERANPDVRKLVCVAK